MASRNLPSLSIVPATWLDPDRALSSSARLVLAVLCRFTNRAHACWPSIETLAGGSNLSENTVRKGLRELEEAGAISIQRSRARAHRYTVHGYPEPRANVSCNAFDGIPTPYSGRSRQSRTLRALDAFVAQAEREGAHG